MYAKILVVIALVMFALAAFGVHFNHFDLLPGGLAFLAASKLC